jgi:hypothetical protein
MLIYPAQQETPKLLGATEPSYHSPMASETCLLQMRSFTARIFRKEWTPLTSETNFLDYQVL